MKKIPNNLDDPVDNVFYMICDKLSPSFKNTGHTPNIITTESLITGLLSCYFLYKGNILLFSIFYIISYFFDCFDGFFARKYNMTSKGGDIYEHTKDISIYIIILIILYLKYKKHITIKVLIIFIFLVGMLIIYTGCQQKYYSEHNPDKKEESLDSLKGLCRNSDDLSWTRFFGPGMFTIFTIILVWYISMEHKK